MADCDGGSEAQEEGEEYERADGRGGRWSGVGDEPGAGEGQGEEGGCWGGGEEGWVRDRCAETE